MEIYMIFHINYGAVTVTVNVPLAVLPALSAAVQVTVVVAIGNLKPDGLSHVTVTGPSTLSVALAE
jgi:hypothetical protein